MRKIDLHHVHKASLASRSNPKFLIDILAEYVTVIYRILKFSKGFRDIFTPRGTSTSPRTAKMLLQGYSHMHRAVGGPTPCHAGSSPGGCSLEKTEPSALQLSHVLINAFSSGPSISIIGIIDCYGREVKASRFAGNLELRGFIWLLQVKGSVIKQNKGAPNEIPASFKG